MSDEDRKVLGDKRRHEEEEGDDCVLMAFEFLPSKRVRLEAEILRREPRNLESQEDPAYEREDPTVPVPDYINYELSTSDSSDYTDYERRNISDDEDIIEVLYDSSETPRHDEELDVNGDRKREIKEDDDDTEIEVMPSKHDLESSDSSSSRFERLPHDILEQDTKQKIFGNLKHDVRGVNRPSTRLSELQDALQLELTKSATDHERRNMSDDEDYIEVTYDSQETPRQVEVLEILDEFEDVGHFA